MDIMAAMAAIMLSETNSVDEARAIAWVIRNRSERWRMPLEKVVASKDFQGKRNKKYARAVAYIEDRKDLLSPREEQLLGTFKGIACQVLNADRTDDPTDGATFFTHRGAVPSSFHHLSLVKVIDQLSVWKEDVPGVKKRFRQR